jgi:hypothetical protein
MKGIKAVFYVLHMLISFGFASFILCFTMELMNQSIQMQVLTAFQLDSQLLFCLAHHFIETLDAAPST